MPCVSWKHTVLHVPNGAGTSEVWCVCFEKIQVRRWIFPRWWSCVYFFCWESCGVWTCLFVKKTLVLFEQGHEFLSGQIWLWVHARLILGPQFCFLNSYWFTSGRRTPGSKRSNWICWVPWFLPHLAGAQTLWPSLKAKGLARAEVDEDSTSSMAWPCHPCQCQPWKRHHQRQEERRKVWKDLLGGHQAETQVKLNAPWMVFQDQPKSTTRPIKKVETVKLKRLQFCTILFLLLKKVLFHQKIETANIDPSKWRIQAPQRNHKSFTEKIGKFGPLERAEMGSMTSGQQIYLTIS